MELQIFRKDLGMVYTVKIESFKWEENHKFTYKEVNGSWWKTLKDNEEIFRLKD